DWSSDVCSSDLRPDTYIMRSVLFLGFLTCITIACATATDGPEDGTGGGSSGGAAPGTGGEDPGPSTGGVIGNTGGLGQGGAGTGGTMSTGGDTATGGAATGGAPSGGGPSTGGAPPGGDCEGYPLYADWSAASGDFAVAECQRSAPCCVTPGCNVYDGMMLTGMYLFECTADHK